MSRKRLPAINIQYPFSRLIVEGRKRIETRNYDIPPQYLNKDLFLIETPGPRGNFRSRIIGIIKFTKSFKYESLTQYSKDYRNHLVDKTSPFYWMGKGDKYGWRVVVIEAFPAPKTAPKSKGICWSKSVSV